MKTYEFAISHYRATKTSKDLSTSIEAETIEAVGELGFQWITQNLKSKIQYQWELPSIKQVLTGMQLSVAKPGENCVVSNAIAGLSVTVKHVLATTKVSTGKVTKKVAKTAA